jgi:hypothetical protein
MLVEPGAVVGICLLIGTRSAPSSMGIDPFCPAQPARVVVAKKMTVAVFMVSVHYWLFTDTIIYK